MELATMMYGGNSGGKIPKDLDAIATPEKSPKGPAKDVAPIGQFSAQTPGGRFADRSISAIGGVETGDDAAQFILLGAQTVQVCTGVMVHGYKLAQTLCDGLSAFMDRHGFESIEDYRGHSLIECLKSALPFPIASLGPIYVIYGNTSGRHVRRPDAFAFS